MSLNIQHHPSWDVRDSSKLEDFDTCNRLFLFKHIFGWRNEIPSHDAYFGQGWHLAREHMLLNGYDDILGAYEKFITYYREQYDEETDELFIPKTPESVLMALARFAGHYQRDLLDNKVIFTEISGTVPIREDRLIYFRMDSVVEDEQGLIFSWDHKTTKRFNRQWEMNFYLSYQNGTYTHCLYCMYPPEQVKGVEFCGTQFEHLKRGSKLRDAGYHHSFKRVPAWKRKDQMSVWLWTINSLYDQLDWEMERLANCSENDQILTAFPQRPGSCSKYWGCIFHDYCMSWPNPLQHAWEPPLGFVQEFWDPTTMETTNKMNLEWKGI